jgi:WD40 repeat protein
MLTMSNTRNSARKFVSCLSIFLILTPLLLNAQGTSPVLQIVYSPDGTRVASLDTDGIVRVWDGRAPRLITRIAANGIAIALPDAETLVGLTQSGGVFSWKISTGEVLDARQPDYFASNFAPGIRIGSLSGNGRFAAIGGIPRRRETSSDGLWWLWDILTEQTQLEETYGRVYEIRFAPTGALLTISTAMSSCGRGGGGVLLWDAAANEERGFFTQAGAGLDHTVMSLDGMLLAGVAYETRCVGDLSAWVWDVASGQQLAQLPGAIRTLAFNPDNQTLAVAQCVQMEGYTCTAENLALWHFAENRLSDPLMTSAASITALAFHPSGDLITVGTNDGNVVMLPLQPSS